MNPKQTYEQLIFEGFPSDLQEKPYSPVNVGLLDKCSEFVFYLSGIKKNDFEARNEHAYFIGHAVVTMHNLLYSQQNLNLLLMYDVCSEVLTPSHINEDHGGQFWLVHNR
jgi:hypothetical protein